MTTIRDITMYNDVGFDMTHKHCLDFPDAASRDAYFDGLRDRTLFANANYNKVDNTLNLECDWEDGLSFSYCTLTYKNKRMFFFVTGCRVVNEKVTGFELQMDVWQTFLFDFTVGEGMVTREHVDRWDRDGKILWKKGVNEDVISIYETVTTSPFKPSSFYQHGNVSLYCSGIYINYLVKVDDVEQYRQVMTPLIWGERESDHKTFGTRSIRFDDSYEEHQETFHMNIATNVIYGDIFTWMGIDPKSVISITYQPIPEFRMSFSNVSITLDEGQSMMDIVGNSGSSSFSCPPYSHDKYAIQVTEQTGAYRSAFSWVRLYHLQPSATFRKVATTQMRPVKPSDNDDYNVSHEPEMFKQPYIIRSICDCTGSLVTELSDVCWFDAHNIYIAQTNDNQSVDELLVMSESSADSITIAINEFNRMSDLGLATRLMGEQLDVPSDEWKSYIVSQRDTDREMLQSTINQHGITSTLSAIIGMGGISGMAGSGKGAGLGFNVAQAGAGAGIGAVMGGLGWIANDYFGWEQQSIKERAIRNQPNNLLRSASGDGMISLICGWHSYNEKKCNATSYDQAARRYHKYGYKVDMMAVPNIRTRKYFNFVQTSQIRIEGAMVQAVRDGIADIFNNGVTIWHGENITKESGSNRFVVDYSKENIERSLL